MLGEGRDILSESTEGWGGRDKAVEIGGEGGWDVLTRFDPRVEGMLELLCVIAAELGFLRMDF